MSVLVRQFNDGKQSGGERQIFPPDDATDEPEQVTLERKASSHQANGWTVEWTGPSAFNAIKQYDEVGIAAHVKREFWIG